MARNTCDHEWTYIEGAPYDAKEDAACYRDGVTYVPPGSYMLCTKCGKRRPAADNTIESKRGFCLAFPFIFAGTIVLAILAPVAALVCGLYEEARKLFARASR